ncbi:MAG TPA: carboxylating nicotinate-nucleotide diphosphorylase [Nitrosomonas sp.]|nr:carboxylating nicotinate-nucleotide diphosphorylase [Nitrosomonas sp.]HQX14333.1 carboxylating nicotinate-nucleotide diphosphorylase [Nitrosomonas sp.]HRB33690.1 carboxylating nicotinate-nucleotide diphosphorylase [Nitrosomonas sp.]HRB46397.1 carboxylating nicotinate-nucleotide diphosphorylase [Nitrosomonas sp.]HRB78291.1 carboxylating nicotinate-nucleotide diphosphorylase [Nitrosomonas sp.]
MIDLQSEINRNVQSALREDLSDIGDLTVSLIPEEKRLRAEVITREDAILCGTQWFDACFLAVSPEIEINWFARDGDRVRCNEKLCDIQGRARAILTAERSALNFLQMLSAVATQTKCFADEVAGTAAKIVDTRKTLPGLRIAQKYAVKCGGGVNHRLGLYDGILIKENHIIAAGGIAAVVKKAQIISASAAFVQIEVETLAELEQALNAGAEMILLDNFTLEQTRQAVSMTQRHSDKKILLEASGNVTLQNVRQLAETGVDRISIGGLTKNIQAIDLSLRLDETFAR